MENIENKNLFIKGFDKDLKCRGFQFEVGKTYKIENNGRPLELCTNTVFHACRNIQQVNQFYDCKLEENNRFCYIEFIGEIVEDNEKVGGAEINIIREVVGEELKMLLGLTNNMGLFNTGYHNTGNRNTGNFNTGNFNTGDFNTGYHNTGNRNTGNHNTGNRNTGNHNTGNHNTGNRNTGNFNTGMFNACNYSNGLFCTEEPKISIFNIQTDMTMREFLNSKYYYAIMSSNFILTEWFYYTDAEKANDPQKEAIGGYLKEYTFKEACKKWWKYMAKFDKETIQSMPNFDKKIFKKITGITIK